MTKTKQIAHRVPIDQLGMLNDQLDAISEIFLKQGLVDWECYSRDGDKSLTAHTISGKTVNVLLYDKNGYKERTVSACERLSPAKRKIEAKRLYKQGLTQVKIAKRLGYSQKTISNDLNS